MGVGLDVRVYKLLPLVVGHCPGGVRHSIATGQPWDSTGLCGDVFNRSVSMWAHAQYNKYWDGSISAVYIDDFTWYALAYLRVYNWTGDEVWRDRAVGLHDWAWKYG